MKSKCRRCAACCRRLILEVSGLDVLREPRWRPFISEYKDLDYTDGESEPEEVLLLVRERPCPFLAGNRCTIYPQRPDTCVAFQAVKDRRCRFSLNPIFESTESRGTTKNENTENIAEQGEGAP
jgi:Fe-S-cluster containining protein